jgi:hypothetical protein
MIGNLENIRKADHNVEERPLGPRKAPKIWGFSPRAGWPKELIPYRKGFTANT